MALTVTDLIENLRGSRRFFLKHLDGLREDQWDWKPYPECKSIRETLAHLIADDAAARQSLETGHEPDYEAAQVSETDRTALLNMLAESHEALLAAITERYADAPLDAQACIWGAPLPLGRGIPYLSSEDYYHAGQVAFIRMATDPTWDYYGAIYGGA